VKPGFRPRATNSGIPVHSEPHDEVECSPSPGKQRSFARARTGRGGHLAGAAPPAAGQMTRVRQVVDEPFENGELTTREDQVDVVAHRPSRTNRRPPAADERGFSHSSEDLRAPGGSERSPQADRTPPPITFDLVSCTKRAACQPGRQNRSTHACASGVVRP